MRIGVDLPVPLGPNRPVTRPAGTAAVTLRRTARPPGCTVNSSISTAAPVIAGALRPACDVKMTVSSPTASRSSVCSSGNRRTLDAHASEEIEQGCVAITGDGVEVRVRRYGTQAFLTIKPGGERERIEEEIEIDERRFRSLCALTEGRRLQKTRYRIPDDAGSTIELDVYHGRLDGLITAEIEFDSAEAAAGFRPPAWLGARSRMTPVTRTSGWPRTDCGPEAPVAVSESDLAEAGPRISERTRPDSARTSALADPAQRCPARRDQAGRLQSTIRHQPRADRFRRRLDRAATSAAGPGHDRRAPRQIDVIADVGLKRALDDAHRVR